MKPFGYTGEGKTKSWDLGFEDVLAIQVAGRKSSVGKFPSKSGDYKSYIRSAKKRKAIRRHAKKALRSKNKISLIKEI